MPAVIWRLYEADRDIRPEMARKTECRTTSLTRTNEKFPSDDVSGPGEDGLGHGRSGDSKGAAVANDRVARGASTARATAAALPPQRIHRGRRLWVPQVAGVCASGSAEAAERVLGLHVGAVSHASVAAGADLGSRRSCRRRARIGGCRGPGHVVSRSNTRSLCCVRNRRVLRGRS